MNKEEQKRKIISMISSLMSSFAINYDEAENLFLRVSRGTGDDKLYFDTKNEIRDGVYARLKSC